MKSGKQTLILRIDQEGTGVETIEWVVNSRISSIEREYKILHLVVKREQLIIENNPKEPWVISKR